MNIARIEASAKKKQMQFANTIVSGTTPPLPLLLRKVYLEILK